MLHTSPIWARYGRKWAASKDYWLERRDVREVFRRHQFMCHILYQQASVSSGLRYWTMVRITCPIFCLYSLFISYRMFGMTYRDFVHLFGLLMARYVPQLLNLKIQSVEAAISHFKQSNISHVIYAPGAPPVTELSKHFQVHQMVEIVQLSGLVDSEKSDFQHQSSLEENGDDILMIYHTSGSTTGRPKLVRYTRRWLDSNARKPLPGLPDGKEIGIAINGISHLSQLASKKITFHSHRNEKTHGFSIQSHLCNSLM